MKSLGKLNGYTIAELLVGLLISALIMAYAASMGLFFNARHSATSEGYLKTISFITFKSDFERNLMDANIVTISDSTLFFYFPLKEKVEFQFNNEHIVRVQGDTRDTLEVSMLKFNYSLKPATQLLESFTLTLKIHKDYTFFFSKEYPTDVLVRNFIPN